MNEEQKKDLISGILARLREAREAKGYKQLEASMLLGAQSNIVCNMEIGRNSPTLDRILDLCDLYEVNPLWVFTGKAQSEDAAAFEQLIAKSGLAVDSPEIQAVLARLSMK